MIVYIDRDFALEFEKEMLKMNPFEKPIENNAGNRLFELFRNYPELEVYSDASQEDKQGIRLFQYILNLNAVIRTVDQFLFELGKPNVQKQLLAFTSERHNWSDRFERLGGLYFTTSDYLSKLSEILTYEQSIRFSELKRQFSWNDISYISKLPANRAFLTDNYLISSKEKRESNLKPLIRIVSRISASNFVFELFVNEYLLNWNKAEWEKFDNEIEEFLIKEDLDIEVVIKKYSSKNGRSRFNFHDRKLFLKYIKVDVGKGFDLLPYDQTTINDKKVVVTTIFNKDTYDDFRSYYIHN